MLIFRLLNKRHEAFICICEFRTISLEPPEDYSPSYNLALELEDIIGRFATRIG